MAISEAAKRGFESVRYTVLAFLGLGTEVQRTSRTLTTVARVTPPTAGAMFFSAGGVTPAGTIHSILLQAAPISNPSATLSVFTSEASPPAFPVTNFGINDGEGAKLVCARGGQYGGVWVGSGSVPFSSAPAVDTTRSIFVPGGNDGASNNGFRRYDPGRQAWFTLPNLPIGRNRATCFWLREGAGFQVGTPGSNGRVYISSGDPATTDAYNGSAWIARSGSGLDFDYAAPAKAGGQCRVVEGGGAPMNTRYVASSNAWTSDANTLTLSIIGAELAEPAAGDLQNEGQVPVGTPSTQIQTVLSGHSVLGAQRAVINSNTNGAGQWTQTAWRLGSGGTGLCASHMPDTDAQGAALFVGGERLGAGSGTLTREAYGYRRTLSGFGYWQEYQSVLVSAGLSDCGLACSGSSGRAYLVGGLTQGSAIGLTGVYSMARGTWRTEQSLGAPVSGLGVGVTAAPTKVQ